MVNRIPTWHHVSRLVENCKCNFTIFGRLSSDCLMRFTGEGFTVDMSVRAEFHSGVSCVQDIMLYTGHTLNQLGSKSSYQWFYIWTTNWKLNWLMVGLLQEGPGLWKHQCGSFGN